jgi:hypothetical protein
MDEDMKKVSSRPPVTNPSPPDTVSTNHWTGGGADHEAGSRRGTRLVDNSGLAVDGDVAEQQRRAELVDGNLELGALGAVVTRSRCGSPGCRSPRPGRPCGGGRRRVRPAHPRGCPRGRRLGRRSRCLRRCAGAYRYTSVATDFERGNQRACRGPREWRAALRYWRQRTE